MPMISRLVATLAAACLLFAAGQASAATRVFLLHDHPNGQLNPPTYGFRWDNLFGAGGQHTFSFDHTDGMETAEVTLVYDDVQNTIRIYGRAYGGKDIGGGWDPVEQGWIDIDFTYRDNVHADVDNKNLVPGDDFYVIAESPNNNGFFMLDGWGGNLTVNMVDKWSSADGYSFGFDNDADSKGNPAIIGDPTIFSGDGWVAPPSGSRDFIFIGEEITHTPVEATTWGAVKKLHR